MRSVFFAALAILLLGCDSEHSTSPVSESVMPEELIELFKSTPIVLSDSVSFYSNACNNPSFQFLIPININNDSFIDFIAHFWCDSDIPAEIDTKDVPDIKPRLMNSGPCPTCKTFYKRDPEKYSHRKGRTAEVAR